MNIQYLTSQTQRRNCTQLHKTAAEQRNKRLEWKWDIVTPLPVGSRRHTEIAAEPVGVVPWQLGLRFDVTIATGPDCLSQHEVSVAMETHQLSNGLAFFLAECV